MEPQSYSTAAALMKWKKKKGLINTIFYFQHSVRPNCYMPYKMDCDSHIMYMLKNITIWWWNVELHNTAADPDGCQGEKKNLKKLET